MKDFKNSERHRASNRRRNKAWRERHPEHTKALDRAKALRHYYSHHDEIKEKMRIRASKRNAATPPDKRRNYRLKLAYGITLEQRDAMVAEQGGCASCGRSDPGARGWQVDHCHETNKVRGVLCMWCNTGIGLAKHSLQTLRYWANYLEKHQ